MRRRPAHTPEGSPSFDRDPESGERVSLLPRTPVPGSSPASSLPSATNHSRTRAQEIALRRTAFKVFALSVMVLFVVLGYVGVIPLRMTGGARHYFGNAAVRPDPKLQLAAETGMKNMAKAGRKLQIATWNIAAINNNPFEYWITYKEDPNYEKLMVDVENFLENPGDKDVLVPEVFTETMFDKLDSRLQQVGWQSVRKYWESDFSKRRIVNQFMKDPMLGNKRLTSMPDRITNTINVDDGTQAYRPTVINMYEGDLDNQDMWWQKWEAYMFENKLKIKGRDGTVEEKAVYSMLQPIKRAKYPDITEEEEKDSLQLQTLCSAIFDAILVHMMNTVSTPDVWQPLKRKMVASLNKQKVPNTLKILENQYMESDIITLQEVSSAFIDEARKSPLDKLFHIFSSKFLDTSRDQNSVIFLNKRTFPSGMESEITSQVNSSFPEGVAVPVAKGDIFALTTKSVDQIPFVVASFHGDTNGLATKPVVDAIVKAMRSDSKLACHKLVFGMDANTYEKAKPGKQQDVLDFGFKYMSLGLTSCWGDVPDPKNYTTYNARTYLQPQLNKACRKDEKRSKGDVNPKDFILFPKEDFDVIQTWKDNTGERKYIEDMAFPTLNFPSDHGILATILQPKVKS